MQMTRNELIENNMPLVYHIVNKYFPTYRGDEDVIQTGMIGLCRAADMYDPEKGAFSTIAGKFIEIEIRNGLRRNSKSVKCSSLDRMISDDVDSDFYEIVTAEEVDFDSDLERERFYNTLTSKQKKVFNGLKRGLTYVEIAHELNANPPAVGQMARRIKREWRSYNGED